MRQAYCGVELLGECVLELERAGRVLAEFRIPYARHDSGAFSAALEKAMRGNAEAGKMLGKHGDGELHRSWELMERIRKEFPGYVNSFEERERARVRQRKAADSFVELLEDVLRSLIVYMEVNIEDSAAFGRYRTVKEAQDFFDEIRMLMPEYYFTPRRELEGELERRLRACGEMLKYAETQLESVAAKKAMGEARLALEHYSREYVNFKLLSGEQEQRLSEMRKWAGEAIQVSDTLALGQRHAAQLCARTVFSGTAALLGLGILAGLAAAGLMSRSFSRRIRQAAEAARNIAAGNFELRLREDGHDELTDLAASVNSIPAILSRMTGEFRLLDEAISSGNLNHRASPESFEGEYSKVVRTVNVAIGHIAEPVSITMAALERLSNYDLSTPVPLVFQGEFLSMMKALERSRLRLLEVQEAFVQAANGELGALEKFRSVGRYSEQDCFVPALAAMAAALETVLSAIGELTAAGERGEFNRRAGTCGLKGAFADIVSRTDQLLDHLSNPIAGLGKVMSQVASGNLTVRVPDTWAGDFGCLARDTNSTLQALEEAFSDIRAMVDEVSGYGAELASTSQELADGATGQAAALQQVSSSMNNISSRVKQDAGRANTVSGEAAEAMAAAEAVRLKMDTLSTAMTQLDSAGRRIAKVTGLIDDIAFQTSLLALNATVEAARAGVHGKGFAVVASEVRNLSGRSAAAAAEIAAMIADTVKQTAEGGRMTADAAMAMREMKSIVDDIAALNRDIANDAAGQAQTIGEINMGLERIDRITQANTAQAETTTATAIMLSERAERLRALLSTYILSKSPTPTGN